MDTEGSSSNATIQLTREQAGWVDRARKYKVLIDGNEVGTIRDGQTCKFDVVAGEHRLGLRIDWARSPEIMVAVGDGQVASFWCRPRTASTLSLNFRPSRRIELYPS